MGWEQGEVLRDLPTLCSGQHLLWMAPRVHGGGLDEGSQTSSPRGPGVELERFINIKHIHLGNMRHHKEITEK